MRLLLLLGLGLFSTLTFGQKLLLIPNVALRRPASADIPTRATLSAAQDQRLGLSQQKPTPVNLIDAPSATAQSATVRSTCTRNNGKPCSGLLRKLIGKYPPVNSHEQWSGRPDPFFTIGDGDRALHPDKTSWIIFAALHAGMWASAVAGVRNSVSNQPANSAYPAAAALTGMDLLIFKTLSPAISVGPPVYAIVRYSTAASK